MDTSGPVRLPRDPFAAPEVFGAEQIPAPRVPAAPVPAPGRDADRVTPAPSDGRRFRVFARWPRPGARRSAQ